MLGTDNNFIRIYCYSTGIIIEYDSLKDDKVTNLFKIPMQ